MTLGHLKRPPIWEVGCGFSFDPVEELDPVAVGAFWQRVRGSFPGREVQPLVSPPGELTIHVGRGLGPFRTWLVSRGGDRVIQVQRDRFMFNWRRVATSSYPRFSQEGGVLEQALAQWGQLQTFAREVLGVELHPCRCQVMKVDRLLASLDFDGDDDLESLLSGLSVVSPRSLGRVAVRERLADGLLDWVLERREAPRDHVHLETTADLAVSDGLEKAALRANTLVNDVFASLIPAEERRARFGGEA